MPPQESMAGGGGEFGSMSAGQFENPEGGGTALLIGGGIPVLYSTTTYTYNEAGNVTQVTTQLAEPTPAQPAFSGVRLHYARNARTVTFVVGEEWNPYHVTFVREFRYDGARQRYLNRAFDPQAFETTAALVPSTTVWTDYDGDEPYGDFAVTAGSPPTVSNVRSFSLGTAAVIPWTDGTGGVGGNNTRYYHGDQIGTTRHRTDSNANKTDEAVYTAFGERISPTSPPTDPTRRYGYAGAWGYQTSTDAGGFPFLHVGARHYDPAIGRFLQRDPIGIVGNGHAYSYVRGSPLQTVDPYGLAGTIVSVEGVVQLILTEIQLGAGQALVTIGGVTYTVGNVLQTQVGNRLTITLVNPAGRGVFTFTANAADRLRVTSTSCGVVVHPPGCGAGLIVWPVLLMTLITFRQCRRTHRWSSP